MAKIINILIGLLVFTTFSVIIFGGCNDDGTNCNGLAKINQDHGQTIEAQYELAVDEDLINKQNALATEIADSHPGGSDEGGGGGNSLTQLVDAATIGLKSFGSIFSISNQFNSVISGENTTEGGIANKAGLDIRITTMFTVIVILTVGIILVQAFLKNKLET
jgi:hypothetical protein